MTFALCLQIPNTIRFKSRINFWGNFVPQMIFLQSIFGYLALCILYKWSVDWPARGVNPPSLLNMIIAMFHTLFPFDAHSVWLYNTHETLTRTWDGMLQ